MFNGRKQLAPLRIMEALHHKKKASDILGGWRNGDPMKTQVRQRKTFVYALHRRMTGRNSKGDSLGPDAVGKSLEEACKELEAMPGARNAQYKRLNAEEIMVGAYEDKVGISLYAAL